MNFDIRVPIGTLFCLIGGMLLITAWLDGPSTAPGSAGLQVNLWTGLAMVLFGGLALSTTRWRRKQ